MTGWLIALGAFGYSLVMVAGFRQFWLTLEMIKRVNQGKHWSEQISYMQFRWHQTRWLRVSKAYREVEPEAPLIKKVWFWRGCAIGGGVAVGLAIALWNVAR